MGLTLTLAVFRSAYCGDEGGENHRQQHGVVSRAQLLALGLSGGGVSARVARGALHRTHQGVYAVGHTVLGVRGWWMAAVLACGENAVLSHAIAAQASC
jgi:hypothetical protein